MFEHLKFLTTHQIKNGFENDDRLKGFAEVKTQTKASFPWAMQKTNGLVEMRVVDGRYRFGVKQCISKADERVHGIVWWAFHPFV